MRIDTFDLGTTVKLGLNEGQSFSGTKPVNRVVVWQAPAEDAVQFYSNLEPHPESQYAHREKSAALRGEAAGYDLSFYSQNRNGATIAHDVLVGRPEVAERVAEAVRNAPSVSNLDVVQSIRRRRRVWSDDGDEYSRERMLAGHVDTWRKRKRVNMPTQRVINVWAYRGGNCSHSHEQMVTRGIAVCAMVQKLEEAGYGVNMWSMSGIPMPNQDAVVGVIQVKSAGQYLNPNLLVGVATDSGFYRTADFLAASHVTAANSSMGYPRASTIKAQKIQDGLIARGIGKPDIVLGESVTLEYAMKEAEAALNRLHGGQ